MSNTKKTNLILLANKIYHDIEAENYTIRHPEIYQQERAAWLKIIHEVLQVSKTLHGTVKILDVGAGNGFVADCFAPFLNISDTFIFTDISEVMLNFTKSKFAEAKFSKVFLLSDSQSFDVPDASVDVITVNSVLHHLPTPEIFYNECDRILKVGGYLIIKHEPNIRFGDALLLRNIYVFLLFLRRSFSQNNFSVNASKNDIREKVFKKIKHSSQFSDIDISLEDVQGLVDVSSPTARGGFQSGVGFEPYEIVNNYFPNYSFSKITTYGYLGKINSDANLVRKLLNSILSYLYPTRGYFFDLIVKK